MDYDDDVERRNTCPKLLPKVEVKGVISKADLDVLIKATGLNKTRQSVGTRQGDMLERDKVTGWNKTWRPVGKRQGDRMEQNKVTGWNKKRQPVGQRQGDRLKQDKATGWNETRQPVGTKQGDRLENSLAFVCLLEILIIKDADPVPLNHPIRY